MRSLRRFYNIWKRTGCAPPEALIVMVLSEVMLESQLGKVRSLSYRVRVNCNVKSLVITVSST